MDAATTAILQYGALGLMSLAMGRALWDLWSRMWQRMLTREEECKRQLDAMSSRLEQIQAARVADSQAFTREALGTLERLAAATEQNAAGMIELASAMRQWVERKDHHGSQGDV